MKISHPILSMFNWSSQTELGFPEYLNSENIGSLPTFPTLAESDVI